MKEIKQEEIIQAVKELCIQANYELPEDVQQALRYACQEEDSVLGKQTLSILEDNAMIAKTSRMPICQDTGMACLFVEIGQDVHVQGSLLEALQEGVRQGYQEGYLRKSIVDDPVF